MLSKSILFIAFGLTFTLSANAQNNVTMKPINKNAPVKCSKTILINASPEKVWAVLTNINNWPNWNNDISKAQLTGNIQPKSTFKWHSGGANIHSTLHTVDKYRHLGWTGKAMGTFAIHNWTLTEINGQTEVSVDESMEGFLAKLFKKAFNKTMAIGMQKWLEVLKKECEK